MINRWLIRRKRKEKGMTQDELAKAVGYAEKSIISRIESGQLKDIPLHKAIKISRILEIEIQDLAKGGYKHEAK